MIRIASVADQMPSLKTKTKSTTGCLKEKNSLRVCPKSITITKDSPSHLRITHQPAEFDTCARNKHEISSFDKGSEETKYTELLDGENHQIQNQLSPSTDNAESTPTCASNVETIFSPILDSIDNHGELTVHCNGGMKMNLDLSLLGSDYIDENKTSCEYRSCNVSDFYISDMILPNLPLDIADPTCLPDYKCNDSSLFLDDQYMILPFLEDHTLESNHGHDRICEESVVVDSVDSSLHLAIHQLRSCDQDSAVNSYNDWDQGDFFDPHMFIRNLPDLSEALQNTQSTTKEGSQVKSVTLVLDLDETLVHSSLDHCHDADFTFPVIVNTKEYAVYVKKRPHLRTFLERVAEIFDVVIFTASQSIYAKQLLDILDPEGNLISRRAYRESCIFSDGSYTKDLTVLGVDLAKIAIIDNSPQVFRLQVNNGIPIRSWFDDPSDTALISLLPFLETLANAEDVRPIIAKRFGNKE